MNVPRATRIPRPAAIGLLIAALLAAAIACGDGNGGVAMPPAATEPPAPPSARPLTAAERAAIADFVQRQPAIAAERESLRQDFDDWQAGLTACRPVAARDALRDFAANFAAVTAQARHLPRGARPRELADRLIQAAELEEAALRQLRDRWQPGSIALFEAVAAERAASARARNDVQDLMRELRKEYAEGPTPEEIAAMREFADAFRPIEKDWADFHAAYAALQMEQGRLDLPAVLAGYNALIGQAGAIAAALESLTPPEVAEDLAQELRGASAAEMAALGRVVDLLNELAAAAAAPPPPPPTPAPPPSPDVTPPPSADGGVVIPPSADGGVVIPPPPDGGVVIPPPPTAAPPPDPRPLLEALDAAVKSAQSALAAAGQSIRETVDDESAENLADVDRFATAYHDLTAQWDAFHAEYGQWRQTDGGCDRAEAITALDGFTRRAADLSRQTRQLPQSGYLRPIQALLSDAAAREETALQILRQTWRPFAAAPFQAAAQARTAADAQRRQAAAALQQLQRRP